ncbi:Uncharacterised protein [Mycobacteroides abscessus subsp. abscessus]|nr:Uncharacterised protein [Mycobacteroides abscessus subsp. abscessus]
MTGIHRRSTRKTSTPRMAAGAFALGSIFAFPAVAAADPAPPPAPVPGLTGTNDAYSPDPPANLPPQQGLLSPLEQSTGRGEGPAGLPTPLPDLQQGAVNEFVLAQNNTPSAPGTSPDTTARAEHQRPEQPVPDAAKHQARGARPRTVV